MAKTKPAPVCGLILQWEDGATAIPGTTYQTIGLVQSYTPPNVENEEVDVSVLDDCVAAAQPSRQALSQVTIMFYYRSEDTVDKALRDAALARTTGAWKITYPDPSGASAEYEEFLGWILSFTPQPLEQTGFRMAELVVRIEGNVTYDVVGP